jgi:hypothetical protein
MNTVQADFLAFAAPSVAEVAMHASEFAACR